MIGHYLLTLTPEQEDRVLTLKMGGPFLNYVNDFEHPTCGCLKGVVHNYVRSLAAWDRCGRWGTGTIGIDVIGMRFDALCVRFGIERITAAIRNRILSNRANRTLRHAPQLETA